MDGSYFSFLPKLAVGASDRTDRVFLLRLMRQQIRQLVLAGNSLSVLQLHILFELLEAERTVKELFELSNINADKPKVDKPTVVRAVDSLATRGYVRRKDHPTDRRFVVVYLTTNGRTVAIEAQRVK